MRTQNSGSRSRSRWCVATSWPIPSSRRRIEQRFRRELVLARQVTHRNVVRIHDLGDIGGVKYLTMPYIEGRTSRPSCALESLPVPRALEIMHWTWSGLVRPHMR